MAVGAPADPEREKNMFGLDTKSLIIGAAIGALVLPRVISFASSKFGGNS